MNISHNRSVAPNINPASIDQDVIIFALEDSIGMLSKKLVDLAKEPSTEILNTLLGQMSGQLERRAAVYDKMYPSKDGKKVFDVVMDPSNPLLLQLQELINSSHNEVLTQDDSVYQVWQDGEVTVQKGGDLLWQRTIHTIETEVPQVCAENLKWPKASVMSVGYIFCTEEHATEIRNLMVRLFVSTL